MTIYSCKQYGKCIQISTNMPGIGSLIRKIDVNISEISEEKKVFLGFFAQWYYSARYTRSDDQPMGERKIKIHGVSFIDRINNKSHLL